MAAFKANIKGLDTVLKRIQQYDAALATGVDNVLNQSAANIVQQAKANAPKDTEALANSLGIDTSEHNSKVVGTDLVYGAYQEFGTGEHVFVSPFEFTEEQRAYAKQFFVTGKGRLHAQPYLFPALEAEIPKTVSKIKQLFFGDLRND